MYKHFSTQFQAEITTIHPGEYLASAEEIVIATILGSCIAVALYDEQKRIGGLNHFMLPYTYAQSSPHFDPTTGKYGMYAMELLINQMLKLGARKQGMKAKVFGGASVLQPHGDQPARVPQSNIDFAFSYLRTEGIPVAAHDVGGQFARKVFYYPKSSKVLLKKLGGQLVTAVKEEEEAYIKRIRERTREGGGLTLF